MSIGISTWRISHTGIRMGDNSNSARQLEAGSPETEKTMRLDSSIEGGGCVATRRFVIAPFRLAMTEINCGKIPLARGSRPVLRHQTSHQALKMRA